MNEKITEEKLNELKLVHNNLVDLSDALSRAFVDASYLAADYSALFSLPASVAQDKMGSLVERMLRLKSDIDSVDSE